MKVSELKEFLERFQIPDSANINIRMRDKSLGEFNTPLKSIDGFNSIVYIGEKIKRIELFNDKDKSKELRQLMFYDSCILKDNLKCGIKLLDKENIEWEIISIQKKSVELLEVRSCELGYTKVIYYRERAEFIKMDPVPFLNQRRIKVLKSDLKDYKFII